jgi:hypothetical protein
MVSLVFIEQYVLESISQFPKTIDEISISTDLNINLLKKILNNLISSNYILIEKNQYYLCSNHLKKEQCQITALKKYEKASSLEFFSILYDHNDKIKSEVLGEKTKQVNFENINHLNIKTCFLLPDEIIKIKKLQYELNVIFKTAEERPNLYQSIYKKYIFLMGAIQYGDLVKTILKGNK